MTMKSALAKKAQSAEGHETGQRSSNNAGTLGQRMAANNYIMISQKYR
jgi:hypothetical protein